MGQDSFGHKQHNPSGANISQEKLVVGIEGYLAESEGTDVVGFGNRLELGMDTCGIFIHISAPLCASVPFFPVCRPVSSGPPRSVLEHTSFNNLPLAHSPNKIPSFTQPCQVPTSEPHIQSRGIISHCKTTAVKINSCGQKQAIPGLCGGQAWGRQHKI